ncbi:MAG: divergent PAP2 family protein [Candidatus Kerfeldbacteria bacterium]|nr:divergent PAP2 family protein [Candidatus Kerfeldbacteria bacterium]
MVIPKLVLIPLAAGLVTQTIKFILQATRGELRWSSLQEYGGMPSAHTAFVVSLTTVVALDQGLNSAAFAVCFIFSLLIIRDAIGLRQFLGQHGRILNMLIRELPDREEQKFPQHLVERLGHSPLQAIVGGLLGLVIGWGLYFWLPTSI